MSEIPIQQAPPGRGIYCNRTLNLRSIRAIGYDMDYTLVHYNVGAWELAAYEALRGKLAGLGWPVEDLQFDPESVIRGLVIDLKHGNLVKANRFGYIKRAEHGSRVLDFDEQRRLYSRLTVDLADSRWIFLNTFFSNSEACFYSQLVDLLDAGKLGPRLNYADLYRTVRASLDAAHMEGQLKRRVLDAPDRYIDFDEDTPQALLDQKEAGHILMLITNSEWAYTQSIMSLTFDTCLPAGMKWRDLFDVIVVLARKPSFFLHRQPMFEVTDFDTGSLQPLMGKLKKGGTYLGGNAALVEEGLGVDGSAILYVGDHIYGDMHVSKAVSRWRTCVILREVESELESQRQFASQQRLLDQLMNEKQAIEQRVDHLRLALQRHHKGRAKIGDATGAEADLAAQRVRLAELDERISPLARESAALHNARWGLAMRTGNDKSHLARQVERHADIYTSRVSNFLYQTPFAFFRSPRGPLPHDTDL